MTSLKLSKRAEYRLKNTLPCAHCGVLFYRCAAHRARFKYTFCSRECNAKYHLGKNHKAYIKEIHEKRCPVCNGKIKRVTNARVYCSAKCLYIAHSGEGHPRFCQQKINCSYCNKEILKPPAIIKKTNFCSDVCQNTYHSHRISGTNNPRFKHGHYVGFPNKAKELYKGFTLNIRNEIRKRDNYICQLCGMTQEEHKIRLHVHHIDYDKTNNLESNLVALCRYCHGKIHGEEEKWQKILSRA